MRAGRTGDRVTDAIASFDFGATVGDVALIAGMQTRDGRDPSGLRQTDLRADGASLFVQEESRPTPSSSA